MPDDFELGDQSASLELADVLAEFKKGISGHRRHELDTETAIHLTLYDQEGNLQTMAVKRNRDMEIFQEWLRRFDRYTPRKLGD